MALIKELKDELKLTSMLLGYDSSLDGIKKLMEILNQSDNFNYSHLRTEMGRHLKVKASHEKVKKFILELWWYGILGIKKSPRDLLIFKYYDNVRSYLNDLELKKYIYYLHRGIKWSIRKKTDIK